MSTALNTEPRAGRVGLVLGDGHPIVLEGLQQVLQGHRDLRVLAACTRDDEFLDAVTSHQPSVVVLDRNIPRSGGFAVARELARRRLPTRIVLLAATMSVREMKQAVRIGVKGVVLKHMPLSAIVQCVRQVHEGGMWIEHRSFGAAAEQMIRQSATLVERGRQLTRRELEVMRLLADGLRNRDITQRLAIAEGTVKIHVHNIYEKLGTNDRLRLALRIRDEGLV